MFPFFSVRLFGQPFFDTHELGISIIGDRPQRIAFVHLANAFQYAVNVLDAVMHIKFTFRFHLFLLEKCEEVCEDRPIFRVIGVNASVQLVPSVSHRLSILLLKFEFLFPFLIEREMYVFQCGIQQLLHTFAVVRVLLIREKVKAVACRFDKI